MPWSWEQVCGEDRKSSAVPRPSLGTSAPSYARHVPWTHRVLPPKEVQGSHFQDGETEAQSSYRACALNRKATGRSAVIGVAPPVLSQGYQSTQNPPFPRADNRLPPQGDCVRRALETPRTGSRRGHRREFMTVATGPEHSRGL